MKTTAEMIEVMKAYEEGKKIEYYNSVCEDWTLLQGIPVWDWDYSDYRIAEEKKYRPYKDTNEMIDDFCKRSGTKRSEMGEPFIWVKNGDYKRLITAFDDYTCRISGAFWNMVNLYENFTYLDGSPCGISE